MRSTAPTVRAAGLTKVYQSGAVRQTVLAGVDLTVGRGEFVAVIGRSGSGKSTLLNLIGAMDVATAGTIEVAGVVVTALSERDRAAFRRQRIGFVFQAYNLIPTLTVRENLELPLRLSRKDPGTRIESLLESLDIAAKAEAFPERLSGGEQQRVAVARALVHQPTLVLADEPTGNLDLDTGLLVVSLLDRLVRESGATLIMATHSRQVIGYADRVVTIRDGHLEDT